MSTLATNSGALRAPSFVVSLASGDPTVRRPTSDPPYPRLTPPPPRISPRLGVFNSCGTLLACQLLAALSTRSVTSPPPPEPPAPPCQHHPPPHRERTCIVPRLSTHVNRLMRLRSDPRPLRSPRPHRRLRRLDLPRRPPPPTHPCPSTPLPPPCRIAVDIQPDPMRHRSLAARACRALDLRPPPRHRRSGGFRPSPTIRRPA